ncbi:branched-chain amino acid ABC transporter substrate-binding protein [Candidatus Cyanaurora vandensis]|uniref:branched-chain amino acid ABC transporter substrate-binding protein n=1 Tax=Candidatus Cyanaurora vandensis TaxID=2714958 RepID=UPI00257E6F3B|nr:branched-chain amino acid ABC transporter substrate-binding protein [Candidatus Cyanaurora vandensis]
MKRRMAVGTVLALTLAGCGGETTTNADGTTATGGKIFIGVAGPISGAQAVFGEDMIRSAQLAVDEINAQGGVLGKTIEIVPGDDQGDARQAATVAQKMTSTDGLVGVVGHFNSGCSIPASQVYKRADLVMLSPGSTSPTLTEQGFKNVFRLVGRDDQQGPLSANFAIQQLKSKTVAILNDKTAYGQGLAEAFRKSIEAGGVKVVIFEGVNQGERDFRAVLTKIKGLNPDSLFFGGVFTEAGLIVSQARELGLTANFLSGDGTQVQSFIDTVGTKSSKIFVTGVRTINSEEFLATYKSKYKESPTAFGTYTYDATRILLAAIARAGSVDRVKVTEAVRATKDFQGLGGTINFDAKGDPATAPFDVFTVQDKKFVTVTPTA